MNTPEDFPYITTIFCRPERETHLTRVEGQTLFNRLKANGYHPMPLKAQTKQPELKQWPLKAARGEFRWMQNRPGVGLLCGSAEPDDSRPDHPWRNSALAGCLLALDFDLNKKLEGCDAPTLPLNNQLEIRRAIGETRTIKRLLQTRGLFRMRGGAGNFIVAVRNDGSIGNGAWRFSRDGKPALEIEILASGRQFAAFALHPAGGAYQWLGDLSPETMPLDKLPTLAGADLDQLRAEIAEALRPFGLTEEASAQGAARPGGKQNGVGVAEKLLGEFSRDAAIHAPPADEMRAMLTFLAERGVFQHRNGVEKDAAGRIVRLGWREAGMALKAAYGDEAGFELWGLTHIDDHARADAPAQWSSFAAEPRADDMTIATICKAALDAGYVSPTRAPAPPIGPAPDVDPTRFRWTDAGNALLFVALFKENIRYVEKWRLWLAWDGRRWVDLSDAAMLPQARAVTEHMFAHAAKMTDQDRQTKLRAYALASQKEPRLHAMLNLAKGEPEIRLEPDRLDADPFLLGCPNGTLDLRTGELREARREDFITKSIAAAYDRAAQCPNWRRFLEFATQGDSGTSEHLQRFAGYALTGSVREEKLFAFFGGGENGKTTFLMTLAAMMGGYADKARKDLLLQSQGEKGAASPDVAALQGKRLVIVSETDEGCTLAEAQVKEITSNEPIAARRLHRDPFTFMPTHKTVLMTNNRPFVKGTDHGIWRRLNIVGFKAEIAEAVKNLDFRETVLAPELAGILRWAVEGCLKWRRDGLKPSAAVSKATVEYRAQMDFIGQWIEERTDPNAAANDFTPGALAYSDYVTWAKIEQYPAVGRRKFSDELDKRKFLLDSGAGHTRGFRGLKLKSMGVAMRVVQG